MRKFDRDEFGRIASEVFPDSSVVKYSYNELGKLEQVIDQNNHPIAFSWNKFGKLDSKITAAGQIAKFSCDKYGMLEGENNSMGNENNLSREISYKYDEFDRVSSVNYGEGRIKNFKYDSWGKVLEVSAVDMKKNEVSRESFKYNEFDQIAGKTIVKSVNDVEKEKLVYEYSYTPSGKRLSVAITFPDGSKKVTKNAYDKYGRLAETVDGSRRVSYKYDEKTARLKEQNINGIPVFYTYTKLGQIESKVMGEMKSPISTLKYFYTKDGQITAREINGKRQNYEYDVKGQLLAVKDSTGSALEKYAYDPAGNILSKTVDGKTVTYTYDESNQLISAKTADGKETSYRYDAAGRLTEESGVSTTKEYTYGWLDKVMKVRDTGKNSSEVDFSYHIDGQLASRRSGDKVENFYWDGLALVKKDGTDYINEPYATGGNPVLANDEVMFNDMLGTTLGSVDNGKFSATQTTAFGSGNNNAFFTGKPYVEGLGYAFLFRNYRPEMGKWQTSDPLGYPDGWNNFAYCNNGVIGSFDWQGGEIIEYYGNPEVYVDRDNYTNEIVRGDWYDTNTQIIGNSGRVYEVWHQDVYTIPMYDKYMRTPVYNATWKQVAAPVGAVVGGILSGLTTYLTAGVGLGACVAVSTASSVVTYYVLESLTGPTRYIRGEELGLVPDEYAQVSYAVKLVLIE